MAAIKNENKYFPWQTMMTN